MLSLNLDKVSQCFSGGVWRNKSIVGGGGGGGGQDPDDGGDGDDDDNASFDDDFDDDEEGDDANVNNDDDDDNNDVSDSEEAERSRITIWAKRMKNKKTISKTIKTLRSHGEVGNFIIQCIASVTTFISFLQLTAEANRNLLEAAKVDVREVTQAAFTGNSDVSHIDISLFCLKHLTSY